MGSAPLGRSLVFSRSTGRLGGFKVRFPPLFLLFSLPGFSIVRADVWPFFCCKVNKIQCNTERFVRANYVVFCLGIDGSPPPFLLSLSQRGVVEA